MKYSKKMVFACVALIFFSVPLAANELARGEAEYRGSCAVCHGADGKGSGEFSGYLSVEPPDITQLSRKSGGKFPEPMIREIIDGRAQIKLHGGREMPVWGGQFLVESIRANEYGNYIDAERIVQDRINALLAYINSLQEQ